MNRKRGGLADSPFFSPSEVLPERSRSAEVFSQPASLPMHPSIPVSMQTERTNERTVSPSERTNGRTVATSERPNERTDTKVAQGRPTRRYSYEFYSDQVDAIRKLWAQKQFNGEKVGQSDLARAAFDLYLQTQSSK